MIGFLAVPVVAGPPPAAIPAAVQDASATLRDWLNTLNGKTEAEVGTIIGHDYQKDTWQFQGKPELKIRFKLDKESTLLLLFVEGKIEKAEIYVISD